MASIILKDDNQIEGIRQSAEILSRTLAIVMDNIKEGIALLSLDTIAHEFIVSHKAKPAFLNYRGFPNCLCISVNQGVVHGIPSNQTIKQGDVISIDCGVNLNNYYSDMAYTVVVGEHSENIALLLERGKKSLMLGIQEAKKGNYTGNIGFAIQEYITPYGYGIVRDLVGHGVGIEVHEKPEVPNFGAKGAGKKLLAGMVIAIEPMLTLGTHKVKVAKDGWTVLTQDNSTAVHFEHTIAIKEKETEILTSYKYIEDSISNNENIS